MSIVVSLPSEQKTARTAVRLALLLETLEFRSAERRGVISIDLLLRNGAACPVDLYVTALDNVEGFLSAEDLFLSDEGLQRSRLSRVDLLTRVYSRNWSVTASERTVKYVDPQDEYRHSEDSREIFNARILSYRPEVNPREQAGSRLLAWLRRALGVSQPSPPKQDGSRFPSVSPSCIHRWDRDLLYPRDEVREYGDYRLQRFPAGPLQSLPNTDWLPFSTFRVGPFPPGQDSCTRVTLRVEQQAYDRLIAGGDREGASFCVKGAEEMLRLLETVRLSDEFHVSPDLPGFPQAYAAFKEFFFKNVQPTVLTPDRNQLIIVQPEAGSGNELVVPESTTSSVSDCFIKDEQARRRAVWLNAWSQDFSVRLTFKPFTSSKRGLHRSDAAAAARAV